LPADVPAGLRAIVERCLAKRPEERYADVGQARAALEALQAVPVAAPARGRRWWVAAGVAAAIALAAGAGVWRNQPAPEGKLLSTGGPPSPIQEANDLFELAIHFISVQNDIPRGQQTLERALELDPNFAEARRYHAFAYVVTFLNGYTNDTTLLYKAEEELRQVEREAPGLLGLPVVQAAVYTAQGRKDLVPLEKLERIVRDHPGYADAQIWRQILHFFAGELAAAKQLANEELGRNQMSSARMFLGETLRAEGDVDGAIREQLRVQEQAPYNIPSVRFLALAYLHKGEVGKARVLLEGHRAMLEQNYMWRLTWAQLLAVEGKHEEALAALDEGTLKYAGAAFPVMLGVAEFYSTLGDASKAVEWLQRAVERGDERAAWFRSNPLLANVRNDPGFLRVVESLEARQR
jgi:tetratricopeptide (TPR) repeat protein